MVAWQMMIFYGTSFATGHHSVFCSESLNSDSILRNKEVAPLTFPKASLGCPEQTILMRCPFLMNCSKPFSQCFFQPDFILDHIPRVVAGEETHWRGKLPLLKLILYLFLILDCKSIVLALFLLTIHSLNTCCQELFNILANLTINKPSRHGPKQCKYTSLLIIDLLLILGVVVFGKRFFAQSN